MMINSCAADFQQQRTVFLFVQSTMLSSNVPLWIRRLFLVRSPLPRYELRYRAIERCVLTFLIIGFTIRLTVITTQTTIMAGWPLGLVLGNHVSRRTTDFWEMIYAPTVGRLGDCKLRESWMLLFIATYCLEHQW